MDHREASEAIWELHDGAASGARREALEAHVCACAECRRALEDWRRASARLFPRRPAPSRAATEAFTAAVMSRLEERREWALHPSEAKESPLGRPWLVPALGLGLAAAAILLAPSLRGTDDPAVALLERDDAGASLSAWLTGPAPSGGDALGVPGSEQ